jgi:hypothetical protein
VTKRALCVGINYRGTANELNGCLNDALDWAELLKELGFDVELLRETEANRTNCVAMLQKIVRATGRGDCSVITWSGHGSYVRDVSGDEPDGRDEVLVPHDMEVITDDEQFELYSQRAIGSRIVGFFDTCHSGTVSRFLPSAPHDTATKVRFLPPSLEFLPRKLMPQVGVGRATPLRSSILSFGAARDYEYAYDAWFGNRANGAFSRYAIDQYRALRPKLYRDFHSEIRDRLPTASYPQQPQLFGSSSQKKWRCFE